MQGTRRNGKFLPGLIAGIVAMSVVAFAGLIDWAPPAGNDSRISTNQATLPVNVLFLNADAISKMERGLRLDDGFTVIKNVPFNDTFNGTSMLDGGFKVAVVGNHPLDASQIGNLSAFVTAGGAVLLMLGPASAGTVDFLASLGLTTTTSTSPTGSSTTMNYTTGQVHPILTNVQWSSCPSVRSFTTMTGVDSWPDARIMLRDWNNPATPFLVEASAGAGKVLVFTPWTFPGGDNVQVELWPYFNYFVYLSVAYLATDDPDMLPTFAAWPHSPVPHAQDTLVISILVTALGIIAFGLFFYQKRKSSKSEIVLSQKALEEITKDREREKEASLADTSDCWEQVGTHKQISGFLFGLFAGILLGIPQIVLTGVIFPRWIMPYPQVAGWFDWIKQFFAAVWMLFDVGTSIALAKYFAQYRIKQPKKAIHFIQIFVWWQMLSGVVQIVSLSLIGSIVFPQTTFSHLSWMVILHSLIQYPGFFVVFTYIFQGMQRTDLQNLANLLYQAVLMLLSQYIWIIIFRFAFADSPQGEAFWAGIGYCIGQYFAEWSIFFIMMKFYKNLGFSVATIFRVDFTREEFKEALVFGGKEAAGHVWVPLAYMYQVWLLGAFLPNYNEEMGLFGYANMLMQVTALVGFLTEGFLAPVSEAHSHQKQKLLDFTLAQGIKWSNFMIFFLVAFLGAVGAPFIRILAGEAWSGAIRFIPLFMVYAVMQPWAWLGDKSLAAAGYTGRAALIWIVEQGGKMILLTLFIASNILDMAIVLYAHIPVLAVKCILAWVVIRQKVGAPKPYLWNSWIAPAIAAIIMYGVFYGLTFVFTGWLILVEFILGVFVFFFAYSFLCGFLGCYDRNTIEEYRKAADMVGKPVRVFGMLLYKAAAAGCRISPFHDKYPIDIFNAAMDEAKELERMKLKLEM